MTGSELAAWRKARRAELIALREAMPQEERRAKQDAIEATIRAQFTELSRGIIGFYWPFRGEMGFHRLVRDLTDAGARAALPVVVEKNQPLQFRTWQPGAPMTRGSMPAASGVDSGQKPPKHHNSSGLYGTLGWPGQL